MTKCSSASSRRLRSSATALWTPSASADRPGPRQPRRVASIDRLVGQPPRTLQPPGQHRVRAEVGGRHVAAASRARRPRRRAPRGLEVAARVVERAGPQLGDPEVDERERAQVGGPGVGARGWRCRRRASPARARAPCRGRRAGARAAARRRRRRGRSGRGARARPRRGARARGRTGRRRRARRPRRASVADSASATSGSSRTRSRGQALERLRSGDSSPRTSSGTQCSPASEATSAQSAGLGGVAERLRRAPGVDVPVRGAGVQPAHVGGCAEAQLRAQQLAQQRVVAVPGPVVAERGDQRVLALELREHVLGVRAAGQPVGEVAADEVDDRRAQQEVDEVVRLLGEHLGDQVVGHRGVVAGERGTNCDGSAWVRSVSAASRSPAAHPSVRCHSRPTSAGSARCPRRAAARRPRPR